MQNWKEYKEYMDRCGTCFFYNHKERWCDNQDVPINTAWHQACSLHKVSKKGDIVES